MRIEIIQTIIDVLRGRGARLFCIDPRVKAGKHCHMDSHSSFGDYSVMGNNVSITHCKIGRYCTIKDFVTIGAGEHDINKISTSTLCTTAKDLTKLPLTIQNEVWIGSESIIRRGINVGNYSIILPNSFVNKDVPNFAIVSGSPAKIIGYRFNESIRKKLIEIKPYEYNPSKAKKLTKSIQAEYNNQRVTENA